MKFRYLVATALLAWIPLAIVGGAFREDIHRAESSSGNARFYRVDFSTFYKGEPLHVSYEAGCDVSITQHAIDGRSIDGGRVAPAVYGKATHDGGLVVIKTPNLCDAHELPMGFMAADTSKPPLPLVMQFDDMSDTNTGRGYMLPSAYSSPSSVMSLPDFKLTSSGLTVWLDNYSSDQEKNKIKYQTETHPKFLAVKNVTGKENSGKIPEVCYYAARREIRDTHKQYLSSLSEFKYNDFWDSDELISYLLTLPVSNVMFPRAVINNNHIFKNGSIFPIEINITSKEKPGTITTLPEKEGFSSCYGVVSGRGDYFSYKDYRIHRSDIGFDEFSSSGDMGTDYIIFGDQYLLNVRAVPVLEFGGIL